MSLFPRESVARLHFSLSFFFSLYAHIFLTTYYPTLSLQHFLATPAYHSSELALLHNALQTPADALQSLYLQPISPNTESNWEAFASIIARIRLNSHRDFVYKGAATLWMQQLARGYGDRHALLNWLCMTIQAKRNESQPSTPSLAALFFTTS